MKKEADRQQQVKKTKQQNQQGPEGQNLNDKSTADTTGTSGSEKPPKIIVATSLIELIVIYGEANWTPVKDTNLLYVSNSEGNLFKDFNSQKTYILISTLVRCPGARWTVDICPLREIAS